MIIVVIALFIIMSVVVFAFFAYIPNVHYLIENDLLRRANSNAALYGMQYGQLACRAGTLSTEEGKISTASVDMGYLKKTDSKEIDKLIFDIKLLSENGGQTLDIDVKHSLSSQ